MSGYNQSQTAIMQWDNDVMKLDVDRIREDFPILKEEVYGKPVVFLDNAASSQKPQAVIDALTDAYARYYANIHRGVYRFSELSTRAHDAAREKVRAFLNAKDSHEIVFTRNATEGVNLVAQTFGKSRLKPGDEILITHMEHHANIVPWQLLCEQTGAQLQVAPVDDNGELIWDEFEALITEKTRLIAVVYVSNTLGTINPAQRMVEAAHARGVPILIDAAQAAPHVKIDVQKLDCDFLVFSGHKTFGPSGVGVLYGKVKHLEAMPPYQGGGDMILSVTFEKTTYNDPPYKFEAGTPDIVGAIGLGVALEYIESIGLERIAAYEHELLEYGSALLSNIPEVRLIGTAREKAAILNFVVQDAHPHDIGTILDREGVAVRTGHHCTQPLMARYGVSATARASMAFYNTKEELDRFANALKKVIEVFR